MPLLSAREAAARFGVSPSTAQKYAREAIKAGDHRIQRTSAGYFADEEVWHEYIPGPVSRGRPRRTDRNHRPPRRPT